MFSISACSTFSQKATSAEGLETYTTIMITLIDSLRSKTRQAKVESKKCRHFEDRTAIRQRDSFRCGKHMRKSNENLTKSEDPKRTRTKSRGHCAKLNKDNRKTSGTSTKRNDQRYGSYISKDSQGEPLYSQRAWSISQRALRIYRLSDRQPAFRHRTLFFRSSPFGLNTHYINPSTVTQRSHSISRHSKLHSSVLVCFRVVPFLLPSSHPAFSQLSVCQKHHLNTKANQKLTLIVTLE